MENKIAGKRYELEVQTLLLKGLKLSYLGHKMNPIPSCSKKLILKLV